MPHCWTSATKRTARIQGISSEARKADHQPPRPSSSFELHPGPVWTVWTWPQHEAFARGPFTMAPLIQNPNSKPRGRRSMLLGGCRFLELGFFIRGFGWLVGVGGSSNGTFWMRLVPVKFTACWAFFNWFFWFLWSFDLDWHILGQYIFTVGNNKKNTHPKTCKTSGHWVSTGFYAQIHTVYCKKKINNIKHPFNKITLHMFGGFQLPHVCWGVLYGIERASKLLSLQVLRSFHTP